MDRLPGVSGQKTSGDVHKNGGIDTNHANGSRSRRTKNHPSNYGNGESILIDDDVHDELLVVVGTFAHSTTDTPLQVLEDQVIGVKNSKVKSIMV